MAEAPTKLQLPYLTPVMALALVVPDGSPDGSPGEPPSTVDVKTAAKRIDRLLELDMKRAKIAPNPMANDATFLRRTYLGIIGRIPTAKETLQFLNSQGHFVNSKELPGSAGRAYEIDVSDLSLNLVLVRESLCAKQKTTIE